MSNLRSCKVCGAAKPVAEYHRNKGMRDGLLTKCKACCSLYARQYRARNADKIKAYEVARSRDPKRVLLRQEQCYQFRKREPTKAAAHHAVRNAIARGNLARGACYFCEASDGVEAHHHDYSKRLDVTWLCTSCHRKFHALERLAQESSR